MRTGKSSSSNFERLLHHLPEEVSDVAATLREHIRDRIPGADEIISMDTKTGIVRFSIDGKNSLICEILPTRRECRLYFHNPEKLNRKGFKLDGAGKKEKFLRLRTLADLDKKTITKMIMAASEDYFLCR